MKTALLAFVAFLLAGVFAAGVAAIGMIVRGFLRAWRKENSIRNGTN